MRLTEHVYFYPQEKSLPVWGWCNCNTIVLRGRDGLLMTDPGLCVGPHMGRVRAAMRRDGLRIEDVRKIFLTHAHFDHAAVASQLALELGANVLASPLEFRLLKQPDTFLPDEYEAANAMRDQAPPFPRRLIEALIFAAAGPHPPLECEPVPIHDMQDLELGFPAFAVELPGHRPGEMGILIPDDKIVVTGDLINRKRVDLPSINLPLSNLDQVESSVRRIRSLNAEIVMPAHELFVTGKNNIRNWTTDCISRCDQMKIIASGEARKNKKVSLKKLGVMLKGDNDGVPASEDLFIAFAALKSIGYYN